MEHENKKLNISEIISLQPLNISFGGERFEIDDYIIGRILVQESYAVVKYGFHKPSNTKVAIKMYDKFKLIDPIRLRNVLREN